MQRQDVTSSNNSSTFKNKSVAFFHHPSGGKTIFSDFITKKLLDEEEIIESFGNSPKAGRDNYYTGACFLKTKTDRFKEHYAVLSGNEIFCYRDQEDNKFRVMHSLTGTFIKEIPAEKDPDTEKLFYPVKIVLPPNKSRILYFDSA